MAEMLVQPLDIQSSMSGGRTGAALRSDRAKQTIGPLFQRVLQAVLRLRLPGGAASLRSPRSRSGKMKRLTAQISAGRPAKKRRRPEPILARARRLSTEARPRALKFELSQAPSRGCPRPALCRASATADTHRPSLPARASSHYCEGRPARGAALSGGRGQVLWRDARATPGLGSQAAVSLRSRLS
jgi:hypothetical protein